jgi:predicted NACHT family NTPase
MCNEKGNGKAYYINMRRDRMIKELRTAQDEALDYYKSNKNMFKFDAADNMDNEKIIEELRKQLFKTKFGFLRKVDQNQSIFKYSAIIADFYLRQQDIESLKYIICLIKIIT